MGLEGGRVPVICKAGDTAPPGDTQPGAAGPQVFAREDIRVLMPEARGGGGPVVELVPVCRHNQCVNGVGLDSHKDEAHGFSLLCWRSVTEAGTPADIFPERVHDPQLIMPFFGKRQQESRRRGILPGLNRGSVEKGVVQGAVCLKWMKLAAYADAEAQRAIEIVGAASAAQPALPLPREIRSGRLT